MLFNELQEYDNLGRLAQKSFGGNSFGIKYAYENYEIAKAEVACRAVKFNIFWRMKNENRLFKRTNN